MNIEFNDFINALNKLSITILNNDLKHKEKILKKIDLINDLTYYNIDVFKYDIYTKENIIKLLHLLNYKLMNDKLMSDKNNKITLNNKLNTILGKIINNAYVSSEYQVLISNIPYIAKQNKTKQNCIVCSEVIYDTLIYYLGEDKYENTEIDKINIVKVLQIDTDKYLISFKDIEKANYICNLLDKMEIEGNIIRVELLANTSNTNHTLFDFNTIYTEKNTETETNHIEINTNTNINKYGIFGYYFNLVIPYIKLGFEKTYSTLNYVFTLFTNKKDKTE